MNRSGVTMSSENVVVGRIIGFVRGGGRAYPHKALIKIPEVDSYKEASKFLHFKVEWRSKKKVIKGKIRSLHGRKGVLIAVFRKPLPGQALGTEVYIYPKGQGAKTSS